MKDGNRHLLKSVPNCLSTLIMLGHCMECPSASQHFPNHSIKLLLVDAGCRGRCHIVKLTGIVRYLVDHLTAECSTSRFYNHAFATYVCLIVCATMVRAEWNCVPKLSFLHFHFMKRCSCRYLRFIYSCTEATSGSVWYTALEPFGTLLVHCLSAFYCCTAL